MSWESIRPGDTLTILTRHGSRLKGRVVMRSATGGWVLNQQGSRHGTPLLADIENTVAIRHLSMKGPKV